MNKLNVTCIFKRIKLIVCINTIIVSNFAFSEASNLLLKLAIERNSVTDQVKEVDSKNYPFKITGIQKDINRLKEEQFKICSREFFVDVKLEEDTFLEKLTEQDAMLCQRDIRNWQINLTRYLYRARRSFLESELKKMNAQLALLEEVEVERIRLQKIK